MRNVKKRNLLTILSIALMLTFAVGGTIAYLVDSTEEVENIFTPSEVTCKVIESMSANKLTKSNVAIENTGDVKAYIRAAVVITWQDEKGKIYSEKPVAGEDYKIVYTDSWKSNGGYYYYTEEIAPGVQTPVLISACEVLKAAPVEGYTLHVEIIGSAIQSEGGAVNVGAEGGWTINNPT